MDRRPSGAPLAQSVAMTDEDRSEREDVDPADALGGAGALPLPDGQARGTVPADRDEPGGEAAPEATEEPGSSDEPSDEPRSSP
jgi:hypothetical protein